MYEVDSEGMRQWIRLQVAAEINNRLSQYKCGKHKTRDDREPGKKEKLEFELRVEAAAKRHFARQKKIVRQFIETYNPDRKALQTKYLGTKASTYPFKAETVFPWLDDPELWLDPEFENSLVVLLTQAGKHGVDLFSEAVLTGIDYTLCNLAVSKWARKYTGKLIKGIDETTHAGIQNAVASFAETPGMTIGDVMQMMPFEERRAQTVAVTEITRAYAQANQIAGAELAKEFPDLVVVKTWFTNNDDRVCDICGPLDGKAVALEEEFYSGIDQPPAHVNCRCWSSVDTRLKK